MTTARDIPPAGATCTGEHETLVAAARHMAELGIDADADIVRDLPEQAVVAFAKANCAPAAIASGR
ncbi:hypothetical protein [Mycobacterium sp. MS1601]|uniref:hypothetical protein n=1 Tax=Mycobacterium sp. MS1601 TaxID=1936029 RepID=UPI0009F91F7D|nr:hypothetical protein [Mycobacterium sp. MS1601]